MFTSVCLLNRHSDSTRVALLAIEQAHASPLYSHKFWSLRMADVLQSQLVYSLGWQNIYSAADDAGCWLALAHNIALYTTARNGPNERDFASVTIRYTNKDLLLKPPYHSAKAHCIFIYRRCDRIAVPSDEYAIRHRVMHSAMCK